MKKTKKHVFMAFASGKESVEGVASKKYIGVGAVTVLGVNPSKTELEKLYNTTLEKDPEYITEKDGVKSIRLSFMVKTIPEKCDGIEYITPYSLFLKNAFRYNKDKTKVQVIDKYGETGWATIAEAEAKTLPIKAARMRGECRPAYIGEDALVKFLKVYMSIPDSTIYKNGVWEDSPEIKDTEASLEKISSYFQGNISEISSILKMQPNNKIKLVFGIKTNDDNRTFQAFYTDSPIRYNSSDYSYVDKSIKEAQTAGGYANTEFSTSPIMEYSNTPTNFSNSSSFSKTVEETIAEAPKSWMHP